MMSLTRRQTIKNLDTTVFNDTFSTSLPEQKPSIKKEGRECRNWRSRREWDWINFFNRNKRSVPFVYKYACLIFLSRCIVSKCHLLCWQFSTKSIKCNILQSLFLLLFSFCCWKLLEIEKSICAKWKWMIQSLCVSVFVLAGQNVFAVDVLTVN